MSDGYYDQVKCPVCGISLHDHTPCSWTESRTMPSVPPTEEQIVAWLTGPHWSVRLKMDPSVSETSPVVRGSWVTVDHVVGLIVDGWMWADILRTHPKLVEDDIRACLEYSIHPDPTTVGAVHCANVLLEGLHATGQPGDAPAAPTPGAVDAALGVREDL
jgi:uncharacterized protein (DUF433 family)